MKKIRHERLAKVVSSVVLSANIICSGQALAESAPYCYIDLLRNTREDGRGIEVLSGSWQLFNDHISRMRFTPAAQHAYEETNDVIQTVSFDSILSSPIAFVAPDQSRVFQLRGATRKPEFVIDYEKAMLDAFRPRNPFDFATELRVRAEANPISEVKRGFTLRAAVRANSGEINHHTLLRSLAGVMRVLNPVNIVRLPNEAGDDKMSPLARKSRGEMLATLPDTVKFMEKYQDIKIEPRIEKDTVTGKEWTRVAAVVHLRLDALKADYPDLGEYLDKLLTGFDLNLRGHYDGESGLRLASFSAESEQQQVRLEFVTAENALIPVDEKGQPHGESAVRFESLEKHAGTIVIDAGGEALGLSFKVEDLRLSNNFADGPIMHTGGKIVKLTPPKITGRALGVFPTWMIDLTIPGSLDGYAAMLTSGFLRGVEGKGTFLHQTIDTRNPKANQVEMQMGTMLVDNFFLNFGMRVVQSFIWPSQDVLANVRKVAQDFSGHVAKDLARLNSAATGIAH